MLGALAAAAGPRAASARPGSPFSAADEALLDRARREGSVTVWSTTDLAEAAGLLAGFRAWFPEIAVHYVDLGSNELYDRVATGTVGPDLVWSSAMDLQIKLVNDGHAERYVSSEAASLPPWALWRDQAYGVTAEPIVFVYHRGLLPDDAVPRSHDALLRALSADPARWRGKIAAYDPELSGAGFLFLTQDLQVTPRTWDLARAFGQVGVELFRTSGAMLDRVAAGDRAFAFDIIGSYASQRAKLDPALGIVQPADYTLVMSRIAFIAQNAPHKQAAQLFLDYLLSQEGQALLAARSLDPVRPDARGGGAAEPPAWRPIGLGPELLAYQDQSKRANVLKQWNRALQSR